jgi:hypothetical protein
LQKSEQYEQRQQPSREDSTVDFWRQSNFNALHVNIRGFISNNAELVASLRPMKVKPTVMGLTETFLDDSVKEVSLEGYTLISRRDRCEGDDDRKCGGVAVFALTQQADSITEVSKSATSERVWVIVHSDMGPLLVVIWYRPPVQPGRIIY